MTKNTPEPEDIETKITHTNFINYRFNQLEKNMEKNFKRIETERKETDQQLMNMLQNIQSNIQQQNKIITQHNSQINNLEQKTNKYEDVTHTVACHKERIKTLYSRLDIYKQIIFIIGGTAISAFLVALFELIQYAR